MSSRSIAALFHGLGRPLELRPLPVPPVEPGQVRVRVRMCTLCGSDLHTIHGRRPSCPPVVLGHEAVGEVEAFGESVLDALGSPIHPGQRITWSIAASCGSCRRCAAGLEQKCESLRKHGHERASLDRAPAGALAQRMHLFPGSAIVPIPDSLPDEVATQANCATATVVGALRATARSDDRVVLVLGAGLLGLTAIAMTSRAGARVLAVDPNADRRSLALRFGAHEVLEAGPSGECLEAIGRLSGRDGVDLALEMSGHPESVEIGLGALGVGGRLALVGCVSPTAPARMDPERIVRRMLGVVGIHNYRPCDLVEAVRFLDAAQHEFPFASLVDSIHPLTEIGTAVDRASDPAAVRVGVRPN